mmetsp:Transcript_2860/g.5047  ORF Transcript_2860/g.5047 Transcript_2860/m.5047 type:complete len:264 (+) Transcript_2860:3253-4044(+)
MPLGLHLLLCQTLLQGRHLFGSIGCTLRPQFPQLLAAHLQLLVGDLLLFTDPVDLGLLGGLHGGLRRVQILQLLLLHAHLCHRRIVCGFQDLVLCLQLHSLSLGFLQPQLHGLDIVPLIRQAALQVVLPPQGLLQLLPHTRQLGRQFGDVRLGVAVLALQHLGQLLLLLQLLLEVPHLLQLLLALIVGLLSLPGPLPVLPTLLVQVQGAGLQGLELRAAPRQPLLRVPQLGLHRVALRSGLVPLPLHDVSPQPGGRKLLGLHL